MTEAAGDKQGLIELLRNLGDYSAEAGQDSKAVQYYVRALALQEHELGPNDPDLVPVLTGLADQAAKAKRYADAEALDQRILNIEKLAYGDYHENVLATLGKLRDIYRAADNVPAVARVEAQMQPRAATDRGSLPIPGGVAGKSRRYSQAQGFADVRVFYGTNRAPTGDLKPALFYGKARGELQYGYLDVTIPASHKEAELETQPRWADYVFDVAESIHSKMRPGAPRRWPMTSISMEHRSCIAGHRKAAPRHTRSTKRRWASAAESWPNSSRTSSLNPEPSTFTFLRTAWAIAH
jgi:hypothetical protein